MPLHRDDDAERRERINGLVEQHRQESDRVKERAEAVLRRAKTAIRQAKATLDRLRDRTKAG
jgi:hypothetical protein